MWGWTVNALDLVPWAIVTASLVVATLAIRGMWRMIRRRREQLEEFTARVKAFADEMDQQMTETEDMLAEMDARLAAQRRLVEHVIRDTGWEPAVGDGTSIEDTDLV